MVEVALELVEVGLLAVVEALALAEVVALAVADAEAAELVVAWGSQAASDKEVLSASVAARLSRRAGRSGAWLDKVGVRVAAQKGQRRSISRTWRRQVVQGVRGRCIVCLDRSA